MTALSLAVDAVMLRHPALALKCADGTRTRGGRRRISILGSTLGGLKHAGAAFVPLRNELDRVYAVRRADDASRVCCDLVTILLESGRQLPRARFVSPGGRARASLRTCSSSP
jgi:hypothetical protein